MGVVAKRSSMTFFSDGSNHYSHRVRIVLAERVLPLTSLMLMMSTSQKIWLI